MAEITREGVDEEVEPVEVVWIHPAPGEHVAPCSECALDVPVELGGRGGSILRAMPRFRHYSSNLATNPDPPLTWMVSTVNSISRKIL